MTIYDITISNCNSIDEAHIQITKGVLNIKYGPNGLGKSTVAKAISAHVNVDGTLADLLPFKLRKVKTDKVPVVSGTGDLQSALIFDEAYEPLRVCRRLFGLSYAAMVLVTRAA